MPAQYSMLSIVGLRGTVLEEGRVQGVFSNVEVKRALRWVLKME